MRQWQENRPLVEAYHAAESQARHEAMAAETEQIAYWRRLSRRRYHQMEAERRNKERAALAAAFAATSEEEDAQQSSATTAAVAEPQSSPSVPSVITETEELVRQAEASRAAEEAALESDLAEESRLQAALEAAQARRRAREAAALGRPPSSPLARRRRG